MWKNIAKPGRPQTTVWRMRFAWWIPESTNIHSEYVIVVAFPQQQLLHERTPMWRYTYIACLVAKLILKRNTLEHVIH